MELPEEAKKYFKYEEYGRENDIPKECKVMSFPKPERPAPDKLEKDEAAPAAVYQQPAKRVEPSEGTDRSGLPLPEPPLDSIYF